MFLIVIGALPILLTIVSPDRYLARSRGFAANAEYANMGVTEAIANPVDCLSDSHRGFSGL
jgi:hypothetical protein